MGREERLDVAILGGGMAGGLLARHLARTLPGLRIALFEASAQRGYRLGESLVEIASHYLVKRLGLGNYLYENHFPKNGLRFFFDREDRGGGLAELSEIGSDSLPFHPAFQIDRDRLDRDLLTMAEQAGTAVQIGAKVVDVELGTRGPGDADHRISVERGGRVESVRARWIADASGRTRILAKRLGLRSPETSHAISAAWGRFEGVADIDDVAESAGVADFRERVRHTARRLSTIHFMYRGYWIWMIPLRGGVTSIGVVGEGARVEGCRDAGSFLDFLLTHTALASLLRDAKPIDFGRFRKLSYSTQRFLSADRYGLVGEAGSFSDPLYSPGSDFIALENDFLVDLVRRDLDAGDAESVVERAQLYDQFLRNRHDSVMALYRDLYPTLGSFAITGLKWDLDIASYYNLWVSPYMRDQHLDAGFLRRQNQHQPYIQRALHGFAELFRTLDRELTDGGRYCEDNLGNYRDGREALSFLHEVGRQRTQKELLKQTLEIFEGVRRNALKTLGRGDALGEAPRSLASYMSGAPLL
ncbi:MAG: NAD(P)/FAD-dependent oxidoreductase [Myxococcales bacterium]|nr:NAD(P)/FAD-dependent oxidoreductase [Myxococcales bacterium]